VIVQTRHRKTRWVLIYFDFIPAAHCFQGKYRVEKASPVDVIALLGKFNLGIDDEVGSEACLIDDIIIHDNWDYNVKAYDADIAVVILVEMVVFNHDIQPICLPKQSEAYPTGTGTIVGWGKSEHAGDKQHDTVLNELRQPAVDGYRCFSNAPQLAYAVSERTFCGGFVNQDKSACGGDSGGGFYFENSSSSMWTVDGIVSGGVIDRTNGLGCSIKTYTLYTNVARFVEWITEVIKETKEVTWKFVDFKCVDFW
jgi:secreted trypsin-like serine protease